MVIRCQLTSPAPSRRLPIQVKPGSAVSGKIISQAVLRGLNDLFLVFINRQADGTHLHAVSPNEVLQVRSRRFQTFSYFHGLPAFNAPAVAFITLLSSISSLLMLHTVHRTTMCCGSPVTWPACPSCCACPGCSTAPRARWISCERTCWSGTWCRGVGLCGVLRLV